MHVGDAAAAAAARAARDAAAAAAFPQQRQPTRKTSGGFSRDFTDTKQSTESPFIQSKEERKNCSMISYL